MWLVSVTERVHQMREGMLALAYDPQWVRTVDLSPRMDFALLKMRCRYAYAMPGVEIH